MKSVHTSRSQTKITSTSAFILLVSGENLSTIVPDARSVPRAPGLSLIVSPARIQLLEDMIHANLKTLSVVTKEKLHQLTVAIKTLDTSTVDLVMMVESYISVCLHIDLKTTTKRNARLMVKMIWFKVLIVF